MNKGRSFVLLVVGVGLVVWGVKASKAFNSEVSRFFTGSPTNSAMWLLIGGSVAIVAGLFGLFRGGKW